MLYVCECVHAYVCVSGYVCVCLCVCTFCFGFSIFYLNGVFKFVLISIFFLSEVMRGGKKVRRDLGGVGIEEKWDQNMLYDTT